MIGSSPRLTIGRAPSDSAPKDRPSPNLPEDEDLFPVATWVKRFLREGVHLLALNSEVMRRPSPPGSPTEFQPDGSNLPWAIEELRTTNGPASSAGLTTCERLFRISKPWKRWSAEEDRHRYLRIIYKTGLRAPSWTVSDGTLRLLALTLVGYLGEFRAHLPD